MFKGIYKRNINVKFLKNIQKHSTLLFNLLFLNCCWCEILCDYWGEFSWLFICSSTSSSSCNGTYSSCSFGIDFSTLTEVSNSLPLLKMIALQCVLPSLLGFTSYVMGKFPCFLTKKILTSWLICTSKLQIWATWF